MQDEGLDPEAQAQPYGWRVQLPEEVAEPFVVYVNGVQQQKEVDYAVADRALYFSKPLAKEGKLGFWRWFLGAWGIGTYGKNDQVDVTRQSEGKPQLAHTLEIGPPSDS